MANSSFDFSPGQHFFCPDDPVRRPTKSIVTARSDGSDYSPDPIPYREKRQLYFMSVTAECSANRVVQDDSPEYLRRERVETTLDYRVGTQKRYDHDDSLRRVRCGDHPLAMKAHGVGSSDCSPMPLIPGDRAEKKGEGLCRDVPMRERCGYPVVAVVGRRMAEERIPCGNRAKPGNRATVRFGHSGLRNGRHPNRCSVTNGEGRRGRKATRHRAPLHPAGGSAHAARDCFSGDADSLFRTLTKRKPPNGTEA